MSSVTLHIDRAHNFVSFTTLVAYNTYYTFINNDRLVFPPYSAPHQGPLGCIVQVTLSEHLDFY